MHERWSVGLAVLLAGCGVAVAGEVIRAGGDAAPGRYLVVLQPKESPKQVGADFVAHHGGIVEQVWEHALNGFVLTDFSAESAAAIADDPRVEYVAEDSRGTLDNTQLNPTWGLDRIDEVLLPMDQAYYYAYEGIGVRAYVIDSGVRASHQEFEGRARLAANFTSSMEPFGTTDCSGHGTHVAGTIAGKTYGVAKRAQIEALRVFTCPMWAYLPGYPYPTLVSWHFQSWTISALDWVHANGVRPGVVNLSLGYLGPAPVLEAAIERVIAAGFVVTVSAGNEAGDACAKSPARVPSALTAGASDANDQIASFSNRGTCVDLFAPGKSIASASAASDTDPRTLDGTSMSAPHVAGAAALILEEFPTLAPADVASLVLGRSTSGVLHDVPANTPNLLLRTALTPPVIPNPPAWLDAHANRCAGDIDASWADVPAATSYYELYGAPSASFTGQRLICRGPFAFALFPATGTTWLRVRACGPIGCSAYRNAARPVTPTPPCGRE